MQIWELILDMIFQDGKLNQKLNTYISGQFGLNIVLQNLPYKKQNIVESNRVELKKKKPWLLCQQKIKD